MSVVDRAALEASPLADLHAIASELSIDGYRRLRRPELIDAILDRQGAERQPELPEAAEEEPEQEQAGESGAETAEAHDLPEATADELAGGFADELIDAVADELRVHDGGRPRVRRRRGRRGGRGRGPAPDEAAPVDQEQPEEAPERGGDEELAEGVVELLPGGAAFLRVHPPDASDDDVYISAAQVKRCELVSGDRISGPERAPRRSERYASLIRVDTINGRPAAEIADSTRFDDLPASWPSERLRLNSADPTIEAIEALTPFGKGSRVTIVGPARAGKSDVLRRLAAALRELDGLELFVVLAGVRPEEISEWRAGPVEPADAVSFAASSDAQAQAVEQVIDRARRLTSRGADTVVLVDTLAGLPPHLARRAMASARNLVDGGSLTVIATAPEQIGGETTVIALDLRRASTGRFPPIDPLTSGTIHPELLVGEADAEAIARTRADAIEDWER